MFLTTFNKKEYERAVRNEARRIGLAEGRAEGREAGLAEGREVGLAEGREVGLAEGRASVICDALKAGSSPESISEIMHIPLEEILTVQENL